jgi:hypothetical protein
MLQFSLEPSAQAVDWPAARGSADGARIGRRGRA